MRRLGRVVVDDRTAGRWSYQAKAEGSDRANLAGNCQRPIVVEAVGLRDAALGRLEAVNTGFARVTRRIMDGQPVWVDPRDLPQGRVRHIDIEVPCRRCETCLKRKAAHWRLRAESEIAQSKRTWFSTFTACPEVHAKNEYHALRHQAGRGNKWECLSADARFAAVTQPLLREFQLYLKRLRKSGATLRYMVITERHTGGGESHGRPHLHALIHELGEPIRYKTLDKQWSVGFSTHKLVDETGAAAAYACKYLTKDIANKPRASLRYGQDRNGPYAVKDIDSFS